MEAKRVGEKVELRTKSTKIVLDGGIAIGELHITTPGEYEAAGVAVEGLYSPAGTIYHLFADELAIASLREVAKVPSDAVLEEIEDADVVILPLKEGTGLSPAESAKLVSTLEPKLVLLNPAEGALAKKQFPKLEELESLKFSKRDLAEDSTRVVLLT